MCDTTGPPDLWKTTIVKQVFFPLCCNSTPLNLSHLNSHCAACRLGASSLSLRSSRLWITKSTCVSSAGQKSIDAVHAGLSLSGFWGIIKEPVRRAHSTMMTNAVKWTLFLHKSIVLIFSLLFPPYFTPSPFSQLFFCFCVFFKAGEKKDLLFACRSVCHCATAMMHLKISEWKHATPPPRNHTFVLVVSQRSDSILLIW